MWWTCEPLYVLSNMALKASIAIFLLRICVKKVHKYIIWTVTVVNEIYSLFFFLLFVLQCRPTSLFWLRYLPANDPRVPSGHCMDATIVSNSFYGYSAISCFTDWTFSILPIFLVWELQMNSRVKVSVVLILAAGVIASSATIVRFPYLHTLGDIDDFLYSTSDVAIWSTVETGIGITASALATLRPLLRVFLGAGSSAPGHGTSARQWPKSASEHPKSGYIRSTSHQGDEAFDLHETSKQRLGITTVIRHGQEGDVEAGKYKSHDELSDASDSVSRLDTWNNNNSQSNLADDGRSPNAWNITVKKTVVQTRGADGAEN
jgi:hypothetical protein